MTETHRLDLFRWIKKKSINCCFLRHIAMVGAIAAAAADVVGPVAVAAVAAAAGRGDGRPDLPECDPHVNDESHDDAESQGQDGETGQDLGEELVVGLQGGTKDLKKKIPFCLPNQSC